MKREIAGYLRFAVLAVAVALAGCVKSAARLEVPETEKIQVVEEIHGKRVVDEYRWLEDFADESTLRWVEAQNAYSRDYLDRLRQRKYLIDRFTELWGYTDDSVPDRVLDSERLFFRRKKAGKDKTIRMTREREGAKATVLFDPNKWEADESLDFVEPSRDAKYVAYGVSKGGDENRVVRVMEVATKEILPDTLLGWRQGWISWLPDNSGFFYSAKPLAGEVPDGEEDYWHRGYFHKLGTPAAEDELVFSHDTIKECYHGVDVSEDGKYLLYYRGLFNSNDVYIKRVGSDEEPVPVVEGIDASFGVSVHGGKIFIETNHDAPLGAVFVTDVERPGKEHWRPFLPEGDNRLLSLSFVGGRIYAAYLKDVFTVVKIFNLHGRLLRNLPLPGKGTASVWGYYSKKDVWVRYNSYTHVPTTYKYDFHRNRLTEYHRVPIEADMSPYITEQVHYKSADGTDVSMFILRRRDMVFNGGNAALLTAYGGFNISLRPGFRSSFVPWLERGGVVAVPNLRGGGEYGEDWHRAGMRENKQNVFDDFIAAAEWLIDNCYTSPSRLAISGGSNGGLLVGAALVQRPELFRAVRCAVPLLDMVRYHKFGLANIWSQEYGTAEDPEQFEYLYTYSPYHNVKDGVRYPAVLLTAAENDARVNPLHAMKMAARLQAADSGGGPILLFVQRDSGHGGGVGLTTSVRQTADGWAFLMDAVGLEPPK